MFADKIEKGKPITVYNHGNMKVSSACFVWTTFILRSGVARENNDDTGRH